MSGSERKLIEEARRALLGAILTAYDQETKTWGKATLATDEFEKVERAVAALKTALAREQRGDAALRYWRSLIADTIVSLRATNASKEQIAGALEHAQIAARDLEALAAVPVETQEAAAPDDYARPGWRMFPIF